jgi:hypothetical protein
MPAITHQRRDIKKKIINAVEVNYNVFDSDQKKAYTIGLVNYIITMMSTQELKEWYRYLMGINYTYGEENNDNESIH